MKCGYCNNTVRKGTNIFHENYARFPVKIYFCKKECKEAYELLLSNPIERNIFLWSIATHGEEPYFLLDKLSLEESPVTMVNKFSFSLFSKSLTPPPNPKFLKFIESALQKSKNAQEG